MLWTSKAWAATFALAASIGAACKSTDEAATSSTRAAVDTCDPLVVATAPITLGDLVGAGRAADGTVYVLDRTPNDRAAVRAFVSAGTVLRRRKIYGSGETPDFVTVTLDADRTAPLQVKVDLASGKATRMGVFRGPLDPKTKTFDIGTQGEQLTLLAASDLSGFTLADVPSAHVIYAATTADAHRFMAFMPDVDYSDDKVRVFYGTDDRMTERKVYSMSEDSSIHLAFDLDGVRTNAQLTFCSSWSGWGPPRLEPAGGTPIPLTPVPGSPGAGGCAGIAADAGDAGAPAPTPPADPATLTAGLTFYCF